MRLVTDLTDFILLDLCSQHEAVCRYVEGWTPVEILEWMSYFGRVVWYPDFCEYIFRSSICIVRTAFYFAEDQVLLCSTVKPEEQQCLHLEYNQRIFDAWRAISPVAQAVGRFGEPL